jgi:signal transduction histidine kinase
VLDCGVGLPDDVETLFQPFHTTKTGGLGLGLSICRTLVTSHGGRLWAERRAERGAAFYVALPLAREGAGSTRPPSASSSSPSFEPASSTELSSNVSGR